MEVLDNEIWLKVFLICNANGVSMLQRKAFKSFGKITRFPSGKIKLTGFFHKKFELVRLWKILFSTPTVVQTRFFLYFTISRKVLNKKRLLRYIEMFEAVNFFNLLQRLSIWNSTWQSIRKIYLLTDRFIRTFVQIQSKFYIFKPSTYI